MSITNPTLCADRGSGTMRKQQNLYLCEKVLLTREVSVSKKNTTNAHSTEWQRESGED